MNNEVKIEPDDPPREILSVSRVANIEPIDESRNDDIQDFNQIPYNARLRLKEGEENQDIPSPHFRPVRWDSQFATYSDSDEDAFDSEMSEVEEQYFTVPLEAKPGYANDEKATVQMKVDVNNTDRMSTGSKGSPTDELESRLNSSTLKERATDVPMATTPDIDGPIAARESKGAVQVSRPMPSSGIHQRRTVTKPLASAVTPPFTKLPLSRIGPMGSLAPQRMHYPHFYQEFRRVVATPASVTKAKQALNGSQILASATATAPNVASPIAPSMHVPYLNILPHLLPKTMVYAYGRAGPLPSPLPSPATPANSIQMNSPVSAGSSARATPFLTPPPTASLNDAESTAGTISRSSSTSSSVNIAPRASQTTSAMVAQQTKKSPKPRETMKLTHNSGYGPVKPGILQLAPSANEGAESSPQDMHLDNSTNALKFVPSMMQA